MLAQLASEFTTHTPFPIIALRLVAACILGFLIGFDREIRGRAAGLRTHMLVSLAAAMFTLVSIEITARFAEVDAARIDPLRVVEAITAGVAFLAAGTIILARGRIQGLTTGAGMWIAGAVGLSCGAGFLSMALIGTLLVLIILRPMHSFEKLLGEKPEKHPPSGDDAA